MENLTKLYDAIVAGDLETAVEVTNDAIKNNITPQNIIDNYMIKGMEEIGRRFQNHEAYVPELLMAARAMKKALELLNESNAGAIEPVGTIIIGTVQGDLHDIGKNLVASMFEGCGFKIINLGVDVPASKFVEIQKQEKADIICLSALLTTTMAQMQIVIDALKQAGIRDDVKIMVGGAPVNLDFSMQIGADAYSANANEAVCKARELLNLN